MLASFVGAALLVVAAASASGNPVAKAVGPSVVKLTAYSATGTELGSGSGFFVTSTGRIVTNEHVWAFLPTEAELLDGRKVAVVGVLAADEGADLAVLALEPGDYPAVVLGDEATLEPGDPLVIVSAPLGLAQSFADGVVSALRPDGVEDHEQFPVAPYGSTLQFASGGVAPGSSGSPVLDGQGRVVGVTQSADTLSDLRFAVGVSQVRRMLAAIPDDAVPVSPTDATRGRLLRTLSIPAGILLLVFLIPPVWSRLRPPPAPRVRRGWDT